MRKTRYYEGGPKADRVNLVGLHRLSQVKNERLIPVFQASSN